MSECPLQGVVGVLTDPKETSDSEKLKLVLLLDGRRSNFERSRQEPVQQTLKKIACGVQKILDRGRSDAPVQKKKKTKNTESVGRSPTVSDHSILLTPLFRSDAASYDPAAPCCDVLPKLLCLKYGNDLKLSVVQNPPLLRRIELVGSPVVGVPCVALAEFETTRSTCQMTWHRKPQDNAHETLVHTGQVYIPQEADLGYYLLVRGSLAELPELIETCTSAKPVTKRAPCWRDRRLHAFPKAPLGSPGALRVVSFNILADGYTRTEKAREELFPYCLKDVLSRNYRAPLILREIVDLDADIFGLQECTPYFHKKLLTPTLGSVYHMHLSIKVGKSFNEGCLLAFKKEKFRELEFVEFDFRNTLSFDPALKQLVDQIKTKWPHFFDSVLPSLHTAFQISVLTPHDGTGFKHRSGLPVAFIVSNTHLFYHPHGPHIRLLQTFLLLHRLKAMYQKYEAAGYSCSYICVGDYNAQPTSGAYALLSNGQAPASLEFTRDTNTEMILISGPEENGDEEADAPGAGGSSVSLASQLASFPYMPVHLKETEGTGLELHNPVDPQGLYDVYKGSPNPFTNIVNGFEGTLDHIFVSRDTWTVKTLLPSITKADVAEHVALPSIEYPSDHIAIGVDLAWSAY